MNPKIKEFAIQAGFPEWWVNPPEPERAGVNHQQMLESFAKMIIQECIAQNVRTAKTMTDNGLMDCCSPHQYNFEIGQLFGTTIVKTSSTEE